jgi:hypothetical protein
VLLSNFLEVVVPVIVEGNLLISVIIILLHDALDAGHESSLKESK